MSPEEHKIMNKNRDQREIQVYKRNLRIFSKDTMHNEKNQHKLDLRKTISRN